MPMYTMHCPACNTEVERKLTFAEYDAVKAGDRIIPCTCERGGMLEFVFNPGGVGFVLRDGVHGGWISKAARENKYRSGRRSEMSRREKDHVFKNKLVPNLDGKEAHSWTDVRDEVRTTKGEEAARTYDSFVAKERSLT